MNFKNWALNEILRAGLFNRNTNHKGMLGKALQELIETYCSIYEKNNIGFTEALSKFMVICNKPEYRELDFPLLGELFLRLIYWRPLTPITDDPTEWEFSYEDNGEKYLKLVDTLQFSLLKNC